MPVVVELYDDAALFHAFVPVSVPDSVAGWTAPGAPVRLLAHQATPGLLAAQLTWRFLTETDIGSLAEARWLVEGLALFESQRAEPGPFYGQATRYLRELRYAARGDRLARLADLPAPPSLSGKDGVLVQAQAWGTVTFLVDEYGFPALRSLLAALAGGASMDVALKRATGLGEVAFQEAWMAAAGRGLVPEELINTAQAIDVERVQRTVAVLTSDKFRGRPAGSLQADAVAEFLANKLAGLGLAPAGEDGTFFQTVPLSVTILTDTPRLAILDEDGGMGRQFVHRQDFVERVEGVAAGGDAPARGSTEEHLGAQRGERAGASGSVEGPLVWVRDLDFPDMQLTGKIVLVKVDGERVAGVAQRAAEHGAAGLLAYTEVRPRLLQAKTSW